MSVGMVDIRIGPEGRKTMWPICTLQQTNNHYFIYIQNIYFYLEDLHLGRFALYMHPAFGWIFMYNIQNLYSEKNTFAFLQGGPERMLTPFGNLSSSFRWYI
jgi:hypothetical protein